MVVLPLVHVLVVGEPSPASLPADATGTVTQPRRIVVGVIAGARVDAVAVDQALRGHLADLGVSPEVEARPGATLPEHLGWARERLATGADAIVWVEAAAADASVLYLLLGAPERLYARHVDTPDDPVETREILGVIIRGLVASLEASEAPADMEVIAVPVADEPPPPVPAPPPVASSPPPAPVPRLRLLLGLGYAGSTYAAQLSWASGLGLEIGLVGRRGLVVAVGGTGLLHPVLTPAIGQQLRDDARLRLGRAGFSLRVGFRVPLDARRRMFVEPALIARGEALVWQPTDGSRARGGAGLRAGLAPTVSLGFGLGRGFALVVSAGLDLWLRNFDLVARTPVGTTPIVHPPAVGAAAGVGLVWVR